MGDADEVDAITEVSTSSGRLTGAPAVRAHLTLLLGLAFCGAAFWFELMRAVGGNSLSWAYVFEWPLLGAFGLYMWWKVIHPDSNELHSLAATSAPSIAPEFNGMLAAWQAHQVELSESRDSAPAPETEER